MSEGREGGGEGREVMGRSVQGLVGQREDLSFSSEVGATEGSEQRTDVN